MADKFVDFHKYCKLCKHYEKDDSEDPCNECLGIGVNEDSHKPIAYVRDSKYTEADEKKSH